jgi:hypothetical protein
MQLLDIVAGQRRADYGKVPAPGTNRDRNFVAINIEFALRTFTGKKLMNRHLERFLYGPFIRKSPFEVKTHGAPVRISS